MPFFQKHAEETELKRRNLSTTMFIIDLQCTRNIKPLTLMFKGLTSQTRSALTSHFWSRSEWDWILVRWARRGVFLHLVNIPNFSVSFSAAFFWPLIGFSPRYGAEWRWRVVIGRRVEPHLFHAGSPNPLISHTVWEEYRGSVAEGKKENRMVDSWVRLDAAATEKKGLFYKILKAKQSKKGNLWKGLQCFSFGFHPLPHPPPSALRRPTVNA